MQAATNLVSECGGETGFPCPRLPLNTFQTSGLPDWEIGDLSGPIITLEKKGYPVEYHQVREGHTWENWRSLSDEMLIYSFGTD
ncbi:MAG: hypothetical protein ACM3PS_02745 [Syntrophothermus sp.]